MLCTKPPPKRVVTLGLRSSRRMTVSWPDTFGAVNIRPAREPKSCVTVSRVPAGAPPAPAPPPASLPAPAPHPASGTASAPRSARSAAGRIDRFRKLRRVLANVEHTAVAAPLPHGVAVEGAVDGDRIEHVVAAREALRQQEAEARPIAGGEEEAAAAPHADEALARAAEREAALPDAPRQAQLHAAHARARLRDGDL